MHPTVTTTTDPDGGLRLQLHNLDPELPPFYHHRTWSPNDLARITRGMALACRSVVGARIYGDLYPQLDGRAIASRARQFWENPFTERILANADIARIAVAATPTASQLPLTAAELDRRPGIIAFDEPVDLSLIEADLKTLAEPTNYDPNFTLSSTGCRAISWRSFLDGSSITEITVYGDGDEVQRHEDALIGTVEHPRQPQQYYAYLSPTAFTLNDSEGDQVPLALNALMRTLFAIIDSPAATVTSMVTVPLRGGNHDAKTRRRGKRDISVLGLRAPENSHRDLATARGDTGSKHYRRHWVRSHVRQQWYPTLGDHKAVLVVGHLRGSDLPDENPLTQIYTDKD